MNPGLRRLALCHYTLAELDPPEFIDVAADAGFTDVSLMLQYPARQADRPRVLDDPALPARIGQRLAATGVRLFDAATCRLETDTVVEEFRPMVSAAATLGAVRVNVNGNDPDAARLVDRFGELCRLVAEHGLGVGLEFMMATEVHTLDNALALIERSGADNAAVTVDALHLARAGGSPADVAMLDPSQIAYVQLCDGPEVAPDEGFAWEAGTERGLPGEGSLPLAELVRSVADDVLLGLEVPSRRRVAAGELPAAYARRAMRSLQALLGEDESRL